MLLLNIWRELAERYGARTPLLLLVGLRGWDNENVIDMIERCNAIRPYVKEVHGLSTPALKRLMAGARAVLMPTLAEGYGLPVAEARAAGAELIVSDIPAFKAYDDCRILKFDSIDGPAWRDAIVARLEDTSLTFRSDIPPPKMEHCPYGSGTSNTLSSFSTRYDLVPLDIAQ